MIMKKLWFALLALALAGCSSKPVGPVVDPALSTLVPSDSTMLIGVRVEDLTKTEIYKRYLADRKIDPLDEFAAQIGVDPRKNLWEVLYISNGKEHVMLGRGKFSNEAEPRLEIEVKGDAKRTNYRGFSLVGDEKVAVMLMGPSMAGIGDTEGLKRVIDTRDKTNGPPDVLAERMKEIPPTAAIWSVYAGSPLTLPEDASANMGNFVKIVNSVESGSFYLDVRQGVKGKATGVAPSEQAAKELHDGMRGLLGLARLATGKNDVPLQRLLDGMRVTQEGKVVNLYVDEQEDAITTILDFMLNQGRSTLRRPGQKQ